LLKTDENGKRFVNQSVSVRPKEILKERILSKDELGQHSIPESRQDLAGNLFLIGKITVCHNYSAKLMNLYLTIQVHQFYLFLQVFITRIGLIFSSFGCQNQITV
jgi:hypothetical protein